MNPSDIGLEDGKIGAADTNMNSINDVFDTKGPKEATKINTI